MQILHAMSTIAHWQFHSSCIWKQHVMCLHTAHKFSPHKRHSTLLLTTCYIKQLCLVYGCVTIRLPFHTTCTTTCAIWHSTHPFPSPKVTNNSWLQQKILIFFSNFETPYLCLVQAACMCTVPGSPIRPLQEMILQFVRHWNSWWCQCSCSKPGETQQQLWAAEQRNNNG